jgi:hypothetical protein
MASSLVLLTLFYLLYDFVSKVMKVNMKVNISFINLFVYLYLIGNFIIFEILFFFFF